MYARHQFDAAMASPAAAEAVSAPAQAALERSAALVASLDLTAVSRRLMTSADGPKWSEAEVQWAEGRYRRFLQMALLYPGRPLAPTHEVDLFWHEHILNTRAYWRDCETVFGRYLHHDAGFGSEAKDVEAKRVFDADTAGLYQALFGEEYFSSFQESYCTIPSCIVDAGAAKASKTYCTIPSCIVDLGAAALSTVPAAEGLASTAG